MQVEKNYVEDVAVFKPFELKLTVQTREEAQALYAMFNNVSSSRVLPGTVTDVVLRNIGKEFYIDRDDAIIGNGVTYKSYY